jgi:hypothetical protein
LNTHAEALKALTWPYNPKLVVVYGTTTAPNDGDRKRRSEGETALFTILTSSPLWCTFQGSGQTLDFLAGDKHLILELAPHPRALWCLNERAKYSDIVDVASETISFGRREDDAVPSLGFALDFTAGTATLVHTLHRDGKDVEPKEYVEIDVGPSKSDPGSPRILERAEGWQERIQVQKVEVYNLPGGVAEDWTVEREGLTDTVPIST